VNISKLTIRRGNAIAGGGIQNFVTMNVVDSTLSENSAELGDAIANSSGYVIIRRSMLENNRATDPDTNLGWGGGINNYQGSGYLESSTLNNNLSTYYGGGIYNDQGRLSVAESTLSDNVAGWGGGVFTASENTFNFHYSTLFGNFALNQGGGIYIDGPLFAINNTFSGNTASEGGGLFANAGHVYLQSNTFSENSAEFFGGVAIFGMFEFVNTIIANSINSQDCFV
jgi:hypothetical protein